MRAGSWREKRVLLAAGNKLLKRPEIALSLRQVAGLQVLSEELKALLKLLLVGILRGGRTDLAENAAGNTKNSHGRILFSGGLFSGGLGARVSAPTVARSEANPEELRQRRGQSRGERSVLSY